MLFFQILHMCFHLKNWKTQIYIAKSVIGVSGEIHLTAKGQIDKRSLFVPQWTNLAVTAAPVDTEHQEHLHVKQCLQKSTTKYTNSRNVHFLFTESDMVSLHGNNMFAITTTRLWHWVQWQLYKLQHEMNMNTFIFIFSYFMSCRCAVIQHISFWHYCCWLLYLMIILKYIIYLEDAFSFKMYI